MHVRGGVGGEAFMEVATSHWEGALRKGQHPWVSRSAEELLDSAYDTADAYFDETVLGGDDGVTFDLARAFLGDDVVTQIVAESAQNKQLLDHLVALELAIMEAIRGEAQNGFRRPDIGFTSMDEGVNGYFVPDEPTASGKIWLSNDLRASHRDLVDRVVLEEFGEALASFLEKEMGEVPGEGDVGYRLMKVFLGEPLEHGDFIEKGSDKVLVGGAEANASMDVKTAEELADEWGVTVEMAEIIIDYADKTQGGPPFTVSSYPNLDAWSDVVETYGDDGQLALHQLGHAMADDVVTTAAAQGDGNGNNRVVSNISTFNLPAPDESQYDAIAEEWGTVRADVARSYGTARTILDAENRNYLPRDYFDDPGWNRLQVAYGQEDMLNIHGLARALADDAILTDGGGTITGISLNEISAGALVDTMWSFIEDTFSDGASRTHVTVEMFDEATDRIMGDTQALTGNHYDLLIDNFADMSLKSGDPLDRFSKEAILSMFTSGAIEIGNNTGDFIGFTVNGDAASDVSVLVDGQWYNFGYYADFDGDAIIDGVDDDQSDKTYTLEDVPASANIPSDAIIDSVQDFGTGAFYFGSGDVRVVTYVDPNSGSSVAKVIDMVPGSETYQQVLNVLLVKADGSLEVHDKSKEGEVLTISGDEIAALNEAAGRRLAEEEGELIAEIKDSLEDEGIYSSRFSVEVDSDYFAYVVYEAPDGSAKARYRHQPSFLSKLSDPFEYEAGDVYGGTVNFGTEAFDKLLLAGAEQTVADEHAHVFQNFKDGASVGGQIGVVLGSVLGNFVAQRYNSDAQSLEPIGGAAGWVLGAGLGGIANVVLNGVNSTYHSVSASKLLQEVDALAGAPIYETDPGVVGTGYSAYWVPHDAEILSQEILLAEDGPYGVKTANFTYTRPDEPNTIYSVAADISDPDSARDGLVLHATVTEWEEQSDGSILSDITTYDSFGTQIDQQLDLDLSESVTPLTESEILGDADADITHLEGKLPEDAEIIASRSAGPLSYIEYQQPGVNGTKVYIQQRNYHDDGTYNYETATNWLTSPMVIAFKEGFSYFQKAVQTYFDAKLNYDVGKLSLDFLSFLAQNVDLASIASLFTSGTPATDITPEQSASVRMTANVAALLPFVQRGAVLAGDWMMYNSGPSNFAMAGNCLYRSAGETSVDMRGETGEVADAGVNPSEDAGDIEAPPSFEPIQLSDFTSTLNAWAAPEQELTAATDIETKGYTSVVIPDEVDAELSTIINTRAPTDRSATDDKWMLNNSPEFIEAFEAYAQKVVDQMVEGGIYPPGSKAATTPNTQLRHFNGAGASYWHQDHVTIGDPYLDGKLVGGMNAVYTVGNTRSTPQFLKPEYRDQVELNPDFPENSEAQWIGKDGKSIDRMMASVPTNEMSFFMAADTTDVNRTPYPALVHRSPDALYRNIFSQTVYVYVPNEQNAGDAAT